MHFEHSETYRVPPEKIWPYLANTDSLNREVDLPRVDYAFSPLAHGGSDVTASATKTGMKLVWQEMPFEWIEPHQYSIRRVFKKGPFREFFSVLRLTPEGSGTRLHVSVDMVPRSILGRLVTNPLIKSNVMKILEAVHGFERYILGEIPSPYPNRYGKASVDGVQLDGALKRLADMPIDKTLIESLGQYVAMEVDERVVDIQPFDLAAEWKADGLAVLKLCLYATRAGLLDLRWHLICPVCRGSKGEHDTMKRISPEHECSSCNITFRIDLEKSVEVRFTPNRAIRTVGPGKWCMGGPMNTPHIRAQFFLAPREARPAEIDLPPGSYTIRRAGGVEVRPLEVGSGASEAELVIGNGVQPPVAIARPARVTLKNALDVPVRVAVERHEEHPRATAALVTAIQEFRDLYATEALAPGVELAIGSLAILFSDLKGSTQMYEKIGDAPAYAVVRRHFEFMTGRIREHRGAVVKTMGDAVMAVFRNPADAVACALHVQKEASRDEFTVKIGIHSGACIAVSSTDYLDYFGSTVNIAQRSQTQSIGGDVVVTDSVMNAPGVAELVKRYNAHESSFAASLRGFENRFNLHRLVLPEISDTAARQRRAGSN